MPSCQAESRCPCILAFGGLGLQGPFSVSQKFDHRSTRLNWGPKSSKIWSQDGLGTSLVVKVVPRWLKEPPRSRKGAPKVPERVVKTELKSKID